MRYHWIDLPMRDAEYFGRETLGYGLQLSRSVLEAFPWSQAQAFALFSPRELDGDLTDFRTGGKLKSAVANRGSGTSTRKGVSPIEGSIGALADYATAFLETGSRRTVVVENWLTRRHDAVLNDFRSNLRYLGNEVFHFARVSDRTRSDVELAIEDGFSLPVFICFLIEQDGGDDEIGNNRSELKANVLQGLARREEEIVVGAYDGEGFVVFRRDRLGPQATSKARF